MSFRAYTNLELMRALTGLPIELCGEVYYSQGDVESWWWRLLVELDQ